MGATPKAVSTTSGTTIVSVVDSAPCGQGTKTTRLPTDLFVSSTLGEQVIVVGILAAEEHLDISARKSRPPNGSSIEGKSGIGRNSKQSNVVRALLGNGFASVGSVNAATGSRQEQMPQGHDQFYRGSSVANLDATSISDNVVEFLVSEQDRIQILRDIQVLETRTIIAHVRT